MGKNIAVQVERRDEEKGELAAGLPSQTNQPTPICHSGPRSSPTGKQQNSVAPSTHQLIGYFETGNRSLGYMRV